MLGFFRRFLSFLVSFCQRFIRSKNKDTPVLPTAFSKSSFGKEEKWDDWEPMVSVVVDKKQEDEQIQEQQEPDFFADMVPKFKAPPQIRIRTSEDGSGGGNKFAVDNSFTMVNHMSISTCYLTLPLHL
eukprot:sb/3475369/